MTVLEVIKRSTEFLARKGVDSARLQTELLLAGVLKLPRMQLYLNFERPLTDGEVEAVREMVRRRGQREPLQHILGSTSFCGLEISVNRFALVPRPETELLAEQGWAFLMERSLINSQPSALDFGTGSGCLAIALAAKCVAATVDAIDFAPEALELARQNAIRLNLSDRIRFWKGDGFGGLPAGSSFDLIISNPPYIPSAEIEALEREVRDFDPRPALDGGADGLKYFRRLATEGGQCLQAGGKLMLEFGDGQEGQVSRIFEEEKWIVEATLVDYSKRPRILIARRPGSAVAET